jgi:hypothetical protein
MARRLEVRIGFVAMLADIEALDFLLRAHTDSADRLKDCPGSARKREHHHTY